MLHFASKVIPCLPVHDSFIVPVYHATECLDVMQSAFKDVFGKLIPVDGSEFKAIKDAMERTPVLERSAEWYRLEAEVTHLSKVDYSESDW